MSECVCGRSDCKISLGWGEVVTKIETSVWSVCCVFVCVTQIVRERDAGMDCCATESLLSPKDCSAVMAIGVCFPRGTAALSTPEPNCTHMLTHVVTTNTHTQSSETATCLLGIRFCWGGGGVYRLPQCFTMANVLHTYTQWLVRFGGSHYCPAQWQQGHASRRSAFCQNWHHNAATIAAAAQDLCIPLRLFILDIFSSVGGWKSLQHVFLT